MKRALFPGSFDPFTIGHQSIVLRGLDLFDEIVVAIGKNATKNEVFSIESRIRMISDVFCNYSQIKVQSFEGLTIHFAKEINAPFILRGLRTAADFEYERAIAQINKAMSNIDSVFLLTLPEHTPITSTIVRDILKNGGDVSPFVPSNINIKDYL